MIGPSNLKVDLCKMVLYGDKASTPGYFTIIIIAFSIEMNVFSSVMWPFTYTCLLGRPIREPWNALMLFELSRGL